MVTEIEIDNLATKIRLRLSKLQLALNAINSIKRVRPAGAAEFTPPNPIKFRQYTQTERDAIYVDVLAEVTKIKVSL